METYLLAVNGGFTLIDFADTNTVLPYNWFVDSDGYCCTFICEGSRIKSLRLHHLIKKPKGDKVTDHKNRVRLDNRRSNLRRTTRERNRKNNAPQRHDSRTLFTDEELRSGTCQSVFLKDYPEQLIW